MEWLRAQIREIREDHALRWFGVALALANVVTFAFWQWDYPMLQVLRAEEPPVCWPFWDNCFDARIFSEGTLQLGLYGYAATSLLASLAFCRRKWVKFGYLLLVVLLVYRGAFLFLDYRLRLNQHYMLYWTMGAYLFASHKRSTLRVLIALFYVWAGIIKLNAHWLSGAALVGLKPLFVPAAWVPASCVYVVVLELVLIWGLFAKTRWLFVATLVQLSLFHLTSFSVVGFYYPLLMWCILSLFVLERVFPLRTGTAGQSNEGMGKRISILVPAGFIAMQLLPWFFPGDPSLTGEGRYFALHMFDAPAQCQSMGLIRRGSRSHRIELRPGHLPGRIHCDPLVTFHAARHICRDIARRQDNVTLSVFLQARHHKSENWQLLIKEPDFCARDLHYSPWTHNDWIGSEQERTSSPVPTTSDSLKKKAADVQLGGKSRDDASKF